MSLRDSADSIALADALARRYNSAVASTTVTWLNHYSAGLGDRTLLSRFDFVATDGKLLQWLLRGTSRTSADLVIPILLSRLPTGARVLAIGSRSGRGDIVNALQRLCGQGATVVAQLDGYRGLLRGEELVKQIETLDCDVVIVGLGAGLQDDVAMEAADGQSVRLVLTCGGFLEQIAMPSYYPPWAYPLRLNWLVRLVREPKRLWRRYTLDAVKVVLTHRRLVWIPLLPGYVTADRLHPSCA